MDSVLLRKVAGRRQRDNRDGKGRDNAQHDPSLTLALPLTLPLPLPQRPCSSASAGGRAGAVSGIAFNYDQNQGKQSIASAHHSSLLEGKMIENADCESDGIVAYCGLVWRLYVKALSCMVTVADRDVLNAQEMSSTASAFQAARESKAIGGIADADGGAGAGTMEGEGEVVGGLKNYVDKGSTGRVATDESTAVQMVRISEKEKEKERDDAMTIPVRQSMGRRGNNEMPGSLIVLPGSVHSPGGRVQVQVQGGTKGALLFMSLVAPDKTPGVLTQALRLLYKHPLETVKCLSTLTEAIMLDRGWNVRTSPLKVLLRLLTPFLQLQLQHKGKGKGNENVKANEMRRITVVKGNMKCISSEDEERRSRKEDEAEVRDALVERKAFLVAAECLRKVISQTSHHSSQMLRLGGPSSSSSSSSSSLSSTVCNEASVSMGVVVGAGKADHPSAVGGILITLLQSRPLPPPADFRAVNSSPALSTLRDCMAYERALKGAQCTVALFDGLRDLLSLSTSSPPIVPSTATATAFTVDSRLPQYLSANINSTNACQAVAEHGLFAQRAGSPEGGITRTPALEVLQCLSRLPQCFLLLDAAHSFSLRRQQTGVRIGIREGSNRKGKEGEEEEVISDGIDRGIDEQRLNAEVMITLQALVSAWQLGVNAIGRHFTGMEVEVEVEGAEAGVMDMQQDSHSHSHSQRSSSAFSQSASQRFGAGKSQYGVSQQVGVVQVEVNTLSILSQFNNSVICLKRFSGLCTETEKQTIQQQSEKRWRCESNVQSAALHVRWRESPCFEGRV